MKRIQYIMPVEYMRGSLSGRQDLDGAYNGGDAYDITTGDAVSADGYSPIMVAKVAHLGQRRQFCFYQIRTRTTVNMTTAARNNMAEMGGACALYAALCSDKTSAIYAACVNAIPAKMTLREFIIPLLRSGLAAKSASITIADGVLIDNPWVKSGTVNVPVRQSIIDKFNDVLKSV